MSLRTRLEKTQSLSGGGKAVLRLLEAKPMTVKQVFDILMKERRPEKKVGPGQVYTGLKELKTRGLITVDRFELTRDFRKVETYFTFSADWVLKL